MRSYRIVDLVWHPHDSAADLMPALVWNFLAVPPGMDIETICASARKALWRACAVNDCERQSAAHHSFIGA